MTERHAESVEAVLDALEVDPDRGLDAAAVRRRRKRHGANRLAAARRANPWKILVDQVKSVVIAILAVAAVLSFAMGDLVQGAAVLAAIVVNAAIGFATEWKAVRSMEALRRLGTVKARVRRDGRTRTVDAESLVPGDIVLLEAGDVVTADLRLVEANGLGCDESALTGESVPVTKATDPVAADAPLAERTCLAFKGTAVTAGSGAGVVVATGMATELGAIAEMAERAEEDVTPLERRLDRLGRRLVLLTLVVAAIVAVVGWLGGKDLRTMV
ncbi:MAG: cation-transporting P-type ATPase, partial [Deinococcus-Thermus bacterium]|nr:cation-transporting P-type ATPase [Deinococcota bacterium]